MRFISLLFVILLPLAACSKPDKTCVSDDVVKILHHKLTIGLNYLIKIDGFYNGTLGKLELNNPHYVGRNNNYTLCSVTMRRIHYIDPISRKRYPIPKIQESSMPYSFKMLDKMTIFVKVNQ